MAQYDCYGHGYIVCRAPRKMQITPQITAIPWQELPMLINNEYEIYK